MPHVVVGKCGCGAEPPCVEACPLEVIHKTPEGQRVIDPSACVDCIDICTKACKAHGIVPDYELTKSQKDLVEKAEEAIAKLDLPLVRS